MVATKGNEIEFAFYRPCAKRVAVVGDFNGWRSDAAPMLRQDDGTWRVRMQLPEGTFRFRYFADGEWYADYAAFGLECGPFGLDSVVRVTEKATR